jgi:DNA-binding NtrC family response regulator
MHGRIGFWSDPALGSEFWIDMPVHAERDPLSAVLPSRDRRPLRGRVLYVDRDVASSALLDSFFEEFSDVEFISVKTVAQAVQIAQERPPRVVIFDVTSLSRSDPREAVRLEDLVHGTGAAMIALSSDTNGAIGADERGIVRAALTTPVDFALLEHTLADLLPAT